jgi:hypothetical protein
MYAAAPSPLVTAPAPCIHSLGVGANGAGQGNSSDGNAGNAGRGGGAGDPTALLSGRCTCTFAHFCWGVRVCGSAQVLFEQ